MIPFAQYLYLDITSPSGLRWRVPRSRGIKAGSAAGCVNPIDGYWQVGLLGKRYKAHRVVALLSGIIDAYNAPVLIDHINGVRLDNTHIT